MRDKLKDIFSGFGLQQLHLLRPAVLWLLIPLGLLVVLLWVGNRERKSWKTIVAPQLRPYLFTRGSRRAVLVPLLLFAAGCALGILAFAGPTWKKKELPAEKLQSVVLIALDCSSSMLATDIQPDRLQRAKFKLNDFLDAHPCAPAGLVAYAGSAHVVLPFTSDYSLIKQHAAALVPRIMPVQGTDYSGLVSIVDSLMKNILAPSTVLLLTDAISFDDAVMLDNYMQGSRHHLEILLLSTAKGAVVPGHSRVLSKQNPDVLQDLAADSAITITPLTLDGSDVAGIAGRISGKLVFEKSADDKDKDWEDRGGLLLIPVLFIAFLWFRKGWVIQWCWPVVTVVGLSSCGVDSKHPDWWYSRDYQGQLLEKAGRYEEAAERFDSDEYKAAAWFKAGNYEAAAALFATIPGASAAYNRGLALARLGRYQEALQSFGKAIELDPALKEQAVASIARTRAAKLAADSLRVSAGFRRVRGSDKKKEKDPLKERKALDEDEQLSSDTRVKKLPTSGHRVTDETASNIHIGKEAKTPPKDFSLQKFPASADQILMRQSVADPAEFLHRRFELQLKRSGMGAKKTKEPW